MKSGGAKASLVAGKGVSLTKFARCCGVGSVPGILNLLVKRYPRTVCRLQRID